MLSVIQDKNLTHWYFFIRFSKHQLRFYYIYWKCQDPCYHPSEATTQYSFHLLALLMRSDVENLFKKIISIKIYAKSRNISPKSWPEALIQTLISFIAYYLWEELSIGSHTILVVLSTHFKNFHWNINEVTNTRKLIN